MRQIIQLLIVLLATLCAIGIGAAQSSGVDTDTSARLTKYLHKNRLPMVGAQISNTSAGRQLMLYGFVATDFGKGDAVTKSERYLHDSTIAVVNNIKVNPEVRHLKRPAADQSATDSNAPPPRADWENTFDNTLHSGGVTPSNDPSLNMPPAPSGPPPFAP
jgi:hypothetical protein